MLKTIKGTIENLEIQNGVNQNTKRPWTMYKVTINGLIFTTFSSRVGKLFQIGKIEDLKIMYVILMTKY